MAKLTTKTKKARAAAALIKPAEVAETVPPSEPAADSDHEFVMDSKPFTDSLKRISEQAKDWGYMARPIQVSEASKSAPRLDDIHGLIREKLAAPEPEYGFSAPPAAPPQSGWVKALCVLSIVTLAFSVSQTFWLQRQAVKLHEAQMERTAATFEQLNATVSALKEELKKKPVPVVPAAAKPAAVARAPATPSKPMIPAVTAKPQPQGKKVATTAGGDFR